MSTLNELFYDEKNKVRSSKEIGKEAFALFKASDYSLFEGVVLSAYIRGVRIPSYVDNNGNEHESIKKSGKEMPYDEVGKLVGKSKTTISDYINVFEDIIAEGLFEGFVNEKYRFGIKRIRMILENKDKLVDDNHTLEELFGYTESAIEEMLKRNNNAEGNGNGEESNGNADDNTEGEGNNAEGEGEGNVEAEKAIFTYNGEDYEVEKAIIEEIVKKATKIEKEA